MLTYFCNTKMQNDSLVFSIYFLLPGSLERSDYPHTAFGQLLKLWIFSGGLLNIFALFLPC